MGSYKDENNNIIKITFDNIRNKYVWNHIEVSGKKYKWHLENTNDIFEFIINKGDPESNFYCPYYEEGYKTLKINQDGNGVITTVEGPSGINYRKMFIDKNHSIFKYIKNSPKSENYDGNIFIVKNKINTVSYNLFSIFNSKKIYIYWDTKENVIKFNLSLTIYLAPIVAVSGVDNFNTAS